MKKFLMEYIIKNEGTPLLTQILSNPMLGDVFDASDVKSMSSFKEEWDIPSILLEESNGLEEYRKKMEICGLY